MRTEINVIGVAGDAYAHSALGEPSVIDQAGMSIPVGNVGPAGLLIVVKNTSKKAGDVTIDAAASHWSVEPVPLVLNVPAGGVKVIGRLNGQRYCSKGRLDLDFNFAGEVSAYRFPRS